MTVTPHRLALGATLREARERRGLTLRDLARVVGVSAPTLSAIENGLTGTTSERVVHLADALGVRVERLLTSTPAPPDDTRWAGVVTSSAGGWRDYEPLVLDPALRGALASFLDLGYHGSTMRAIAERAGLSVAGLYHYYPGKQHLLVTLLDLTMSDLAARTDLVLADADVEAGGDPATRFALLVECQALYHTHRRELAFIGASEMRSLDRPARERIAAVRSDEQRKVDQPVAEACASGVFGTTRPHEASRAVITMCTALASWYRPGGPASPEQIAEQYVDFALDLVRCDPAARPVRTGV